jgi:beta-lactamase class A
LRIGLIVTLILLAALITGEAIGQKNIATIARSARGKIGVACSLPDSELDCDVHAHAHLPMQSVYKFPIAMATLDAVEHGKLAFDRPLRFLPSDNISTLQYAPLRDKYPSANVDVPLEELLRLAVADSDGIASDILVRSLGGPDAVNRYVHDLGITGIEIRDTEKSMAAEHQLQYRNYAEPAAMVKLLRRLCDNSPLRPENTQRLLTWMTESGTGPHRLKGMLPAGTPVAHKTGTSYTERGITAATNDVGLITLPDGRKLAIAVFVSDSPDSENVREAVIARITAAAYRQATRRR